MGDVIQLEEPSSFIEDFVIVYCCQRVTINYSDQSQRVREIIGSPSIYKIGSYSFNYEYKLTAQATFRSSSQLPEIVNLDKAINFKDGSQNIQLPNHKSLDLYLNTSQSNMEVNSSRKSDGCNDQNLSEEAQNDFNMVCDLDEGSRNWDQDKNDVYEIEKDIVQKRRAKLKPQKFRKVCPGFSFSTNPSKKIVCEECNKEFKMQVSYLMHKAIHSFQIDSGKFVCNACKKTYLSAIKLIQHKRTMCLYPEYVCKFCGKKHVSKELLAYHTSNSCSAFQAIAHTCPKCLKKFFTRNGFLKHQRKKACRDNSSTSETEGPVKYQCELCGKVYATKSSLSKHIRCHKGIKNYECDKCRKCFADNHQLSVHQRMHSGEKPYLCNQCGKFFGQAGHLNRHLRKHSPSSTPSFCGNNIKRDRKDCVTTKR